MIFAILSVAVSPSDSASAETVATATVQDLIFADSFKSGNLTAWTSAVTNTNNLSVTTSAALTGTYGLRANLANNNVMYVQDDTPNAETEYRARFYFNPNPITMTTGTTHTVFICYQNTSTVVLRVDFGYTAPNFQIQAGLVTTASTWTTTSWYTITKASHYIELDWRAAVSGGLTLWIDGVQKANLTGVNNNTRRVDMARLGPVAGITTNTRGVEYFDGFMSHRTSYIGGFSSQQSQGRALAMHIALATATPNAIPFLSATPSPTLSATPTTWQRPAAQEIYRLNPGLASLPRLVAAASALAGNGGLVTTVISYRYDALYRLTEAAYSNGQYFRYSYDADGNRLLQYQTGGQATAYSYDIANRLTQVGATAYQWDANGNLLNDGASAYAYDAANRLVSVVQGTNVYSYTYNGTGDRLSQSVNGVSTNYTLDLNAGLTQVLVDGTNTYLYGLARVGELQSGGFVYHLGDALGSVRQLASANGDLTLAQSYEPFGDVLTSVGNGTTVFQFTGEQSDGYTRLLYLRARFYSLYLGRFLAQDTWVGDNRDPRSLNAWAYAYGNPVSNTDPSGRITQAEDPEASRVLQSLTAAYGVHINKDWGPAGLVQTNQVPPFFTIVKCWNYGAWNSVDELLTVLNSVTDIGNAMGGVAKFRSAMQNQPVDVFRIQGNDSRTFAPPGFLSGYADVVVRDFNPKDPKSKHDLIHEFGHVWDERTGWRLSDGMVSKLGTKQCTYENFYQVCRYDVTKGIENPVGDPKNPYPNDDANLVLPRFIQGPWEDWADSFAVYVNPSFYQTNGFRTLGPIRRQYIQDQIAAIP